MSNYRVIIKNFAANGAGFFVVALLAFLMLPFIIHRVGDATYGLWAIVLSLSGYMGILNLGLRPAINKYVAEYNARNEQHKIVELVKAGIFIYSFSAVLIIILSLTVAWNLERLFTLPVESIEDAKLIVVFVGIQMSLGLIAVVYGGVISGLQRYDINNGIEIFVMISRTALILISLSYYQNIYALAVPHLAMTITGYLLTYYFARKLISLDSTTGLFRLPDKETLKVLVRFSSITFTINIVGSLLAYLDNILVASIVSVTFVTYYVIGNRLVTYTKKMLDAFVTVLSPAASVYYATDESYRLQSLFIYSIKMCKLISFPCLIFFLISGRSFIHYWIGYD
jgi:O-antigen/teichoic acid export membrane protein